MQITGKLLTYLNKDIANPIFLNEYYTKLVFQWVIFIWNTANPNNNQRLHRNDWKLFHESFTQMNF